MVMITEPYETNFLVKARGTRSFTYFQTWNMNGNNFLLIQSIIVCMER